MHAFSEYVVKVASRCNLNCDYCYEYNLGDQTWRDQPKRMSAATMRVLAMRIAEHCSAHGVEEVTISLHGGEPLLVGAPALDEYCTILRSALGRTCALNIGMQTNATLIDSAIVDVIQRHGILVSVSVDGPRVSNNLHRNDHKGRSSFDATMAGIRMLQTHAPAHLTGALAVIDLRTDPAAAFEFMAALGTDMVDFLLPHHSWDRPPPRPDGDPVAYGRWYWRIYEAWTAGNHCRLDVRYLTNIVRQLAGGRPIVEGMALTPCQIVTVAADGSIEGVDCLKSTASGAQSTGFSVLEGSFDQALGAPAIALRQSGEAQLCSTCLGCRNMRVCAGGYFPHRYSLARGFDSPSVYCHDLFWLVERIRGDLRGSKIA